MKFEKHQVDLINYRREKAFETLRHIEVLIDQKMLAIAMNRIYYAGFYIVNALSLLDQQNFSKHQGLIGYFNRTYLKNNLINRDVGKILNDSFERRNAADYHDYVSVNKTEVKTYYRQMKKFVKIVDDVIKKKLDASL